MLWLWLWLGRQGEGWASDQAKPDWSACFDSLAEAPAGLACLVLELCFVWFDCQSLVRDACKLQSELDWSWSCDKSWHLDLEGSTRPDLGWPVGNRADTAGCDSIVQR